MSTVAQNKAVNRLVKLYSHVVPQLHEDARDNGWKSLVVLMVHSLASNRRLTTYQKNQVISDAVYIMNGNSYDGVPESLNVFIFASLTVESLIPQTSLLRLLCCHGPPATVE